MISVQVKVRGMVRQGMNFDILVILYGVKNLSLPLVANEGE